MTDSNPKTCEECLSVYYLAFNYYILLGGINMNVQMNLKRKLNFELSEELPQSDCNYFYIFLQLWAYLHFTAYFE